MSQDLPIPDQINVRDAGAELVCEHVESIPFGAELYRVGECKVIQSDGRHLSISHPTRYPTWDEIACARYALLPKLRDCVMLLPPEDDYVNLHEFCFHIHLLRNLAPGGRFHNPENW